MPERRMIAVDDQLWEMAMKALDLTTTRDCVTVATREYLPVVTRRLLAAGAEHREPCIQKARTISDVSWDTLKLASLRVALGQVELLRCVLVLAARSQPAKGTN